MDAAEAWLAAHDPDYPQTRQAWKDINEDGDYETPWHEIPWGTAANVATLIEIGRARAVTPASARHCAHCDAPFVSQTKWHIYCSRACWEHARPPRPRPDHDNRKRDRDRAEYMRQYRRRTK